MRGHYWALLGLTVSVVITLTAAQDTDQTATGSGGMEAHGLILLGTMVGFGFAATQWYIVSKIDLTPGKDDGEDAQPLNDTDAKSAMVNIYEAIRDGAQAFLKAEYTACLIFVVFFSGLVFVLTARHGDETNWTVGAYTALAYLVGALTSMVSGYVGMMVAVFSNARTTVGAQAGWTAAFNTAFRAGTVMGFLLCGLGLLTLFFIIIITSGAYGLDQAKILFECTAGFGLGGSSVALFGRVGGGIYTKAADVGADLAGKVIQDLPEDDPRNPAVIADNVGDNVGDVAGMGSDLFGSFAEATCAALIVASTSPEIVSAGWGAVLYPLTITALGIIVSAPVALVALHMHTVQKETDVEMVLKLQLFLSTITMLVLVYPLTLYFLPESFTISLGTTTTTVTPWLAFVCVGAGLIGGMIIGFITEYYTSHSYTPVREVAQSCETGAATGIIYGLSLGYKSAIIPIFIIAIDVFISFYFAGMYGVALAALGMLGTLATCLAIDVYGPVCDNAGGIAEMAGLPEEVRNITDALDAAGNTTAAIGKGFAIGSAALVSLALFGGFVTRIDGEGSGSVDIMQPITFASLFVGGMLPYWFTALTMKSVGTAAMSMVKEVKRQFDTIPGLLEGAAGHAPPDHAKCIAIATDASLREMILPGLLVIFAPIITGVVFGVAAVQGLLVGSLVSGVQLAISQSNSGGAWDNAKKYVERGSVEVDGEVQKKGSELHKATVVGDTVGDPMKDTSGPALNILMKLMAIISLVFADFFMSINGGKGLVNI